MSSAFQPEKASGLTGSPVKPLRLATIAGLGPKGPSPSKPMGVSVPHVGSPGTLAKPTHNFAVPMNGNHVQHEKRIGV